MWPDIEAAIISHLNATLSVRAATSTPSNLEDLPGFVRVSRAPGGDDGITDSPTVDVETFAPKRPAARDLAEEVRQAIHELKGRRVEGLLFDVAETNVGPHWVDYRNPAVHRYVALYRFRYRKY